jgi:plasmid stability protein
MSSIHIRDVPEPVMAALRERARRHGQSMQRELHQILVEATANRSPDTAIAPLALHTVRANSSSTWRREEIYGDSGR